MRQFRPPKKGHKIRNVDYCGFLIPQLPNPRSHIVTEFGIVIGAANGALRL